MKIKTKGLYAVIALVLLFSISCEKSNDGQSDQQAVVLPPYGTMVADFGDFSEAQSDAAGKAIASSAKTSQNWAYSAVVVGFWNTALFSTLAVPVASFKTAFNHKAVYLGDQKWQWTYTVDGFTNQYAARLTGELSGDKVVWEMYVTKSGVGAFDEFLWFSGESAADGNSGFWLLNQSADHPEKVLRIDWEKENDTIGNIKYTWVRENDDEGNADPYNGSNLIYGLQEGDLDAFVNVHIYNPDMETFADVAIEWSRTNFNGHVMSSQYFGDEDWHCWNSTGEDMVCE